MKKFLGAGLTCLYLDQFAASNIFDESTDKLWEQVSVLITKKASEGKIICPMPMEHLLESSNKIEERAITLDLKFHELSKGYAFLPEAEIASNYIESIVRKRKIISTDLFGHMRFDNTLSQKGAYYSAGQKHHELKKQVEHAVAATNEVRTHLREKRFSWKVLEPFYEAVKLLQVKHFQDRLHELLTTGQIISRGVKFNDSQVIDWVDLLLQLLIYKHHLHASEGMALHQHIGVNAFDYIPPLDIRCSLTALIAVENKKESVNDQIDIMRISSGLVSSDLMFTDKQRKYELEFTGLAKKYGTKIFSGSKNDLEELLLELGKL